MREALSRRPRIAISAGEDGSIAIGKILEKAVQLRVPTRRPANTSTLVSRHHRPDQGRAYSDPERGFHYTFAPNRQLSGPANHDVNCEERSAGAGASPPGGGMSGGLIHPFRRLQK